MNTIVVDEIPGATMTYDDLFYNSKNFIFNEYKLIVNFENKEKEKWKVITQEDGIVFCGYDVLDYFEGLKKGESPAIKMYRDLCYSTEQNGMVITDNGEFAHGKLAVPLSHIEWSKTTDWYERLFNTEYYYNLAVSVGLMIYGIMAYIMNESKKRDKQIRKKNNNTIAKKQSKKYEQIDKRVFLLDDIINYVSDSYIPSASHHEIQCPCWEVRGHYRHYKSGRVIFIPSYKKGKHKDTAPPKPKTYYAMRGESKHGKI